MTMLNELEYIGSFIYANVWMSSLICRIDPISGLVVQWLEVGHLHPQPNNRDMTPNGIAFDHQTQRMFITGKLWPTLFEIEFEGGEANMDSAAATTR